MPNMPNQGNYQKDLERLLDKLPEDQNSAKSRCFIAAVRLGSSYVLSVPVFCHHRVLL